MFLTILCFESYDSVILAALAKIEVSSMKSHSFGPPNLDCSICTPSGSLSSILKNT